MQLIEYDKKYHDQVVALILDIQNNEAKIALSLEQQPDLYDIERSYMDKGGNFWLALDENDRVIGTIGVLNKGNGYGILKKFFVQVEYRSQKVGLQLYQALQAFCVAKGFKVLILDTPAVAKASHRFYEKNDFIQITSKDLPIPYEFPDRDSLLYLKKL